MNGHRRSNFGIRFFGALGGILWGYDTGVIYLGRDIPLSPIGQDIASFSVSWGPVQWVALPALFPLRVRAAAVGLCVVLDGLFNLAVALVFPSLLARFGAGLNFLFFAVMTGLA